MKGFYFLAILSRHCHPCTEGFYFPAILFRPCHPWVLSGGLPFSSDSIETLPPLGTQWRASFFWRFYRDTATLALRASIFQRFYPDTATLGYSLEGFYFPATMSENEGFSIFQRHCNTFFFSRHFLLFRHYHPSIFSGVACFYLPATLIFSRHTDQWRDFCFPATLQHFFLLATLLISL